MKTHKVHFERWHNPDLHPLMHRMSELFHDSRFWAVVLMGAVIALLLIAATLLVGDGQPRPVPPYSYPIFPYHGF